MMMAVGFWFGEGGYERHNGERKGGTVDGLEDWVSMKICSFILQIYGIMFGGLGAPEGSDESVSFRTSTK